MELAVTLVRSVMRAFYSTREILVIDALILHETLRDDDLAYLMSMNTKDLHKICGKLREDRFLTVHTRPEWREGNARPHNKTWYYINYRYTIDAIKWRVYTIDKEVQGTNEVVTEKKEYFCVFCKAEWTTMEVLDRHGPDGFVCHRCGHVLQFEADRNATGHEQSTRLNEQFKFISHLLPRIDSMHVPVCDFDRAFERRRPVVRDATHQRVETTGVDPNAGKPMAVKGLSNVGPQSIAVNISTAEGPSEAEKEAERLRKEKIAQQNALPSWMASSTVTGDSYTGDAAAAASSAPLKAEEEDTKNDETLVDAKASAQIDDIFEKLKAEQAAERARELEEEGTDDDGADGDESESGDDEFENVPASGTGTSSIGTPAIKREASGAASGEERSSAERSAKRVKVESEPPILIKKEEDSEEDEDEDIEFEDV